nr:Uncharacterised protein [Klebsiella pneumoniae]
MASGDVWLKRGASWQGDNEVHHLSVDNLTAHLSHDKQSWAFIFPIRGSLSMINPAKRSPGDGVDPGAGRWWRRSSA